MLHYVIHADQGWKRRHGQKRLALALKVAGAATEVLERTMHALEQEIIR